jgi:hypothetical protein
VLVRFFLYSVHQFKLSGLEYKYMFIYDCEHIDNLKTMMTIYNVMVIHNYFCNSYLISLDDSF